MTEKTRSYEEYPPDMHEFTFEGWKYQWCHELALMIDNDQVLLEKVRRLISQIIDRKHGDRERMVNELPRRLRAICPQPGGGCPIDGWEELLEHYEAQVLEERRYEAND
jgi:hypothetical protein